jgi:hypothetical protein
VGVCVYVCACVRLIVSASVSVCVCVCECECECECVAYLGSLLIPFLYSTYFYLIPFINKCSMFSKKITMKMLGMIIPHIQ